MQFPVMLLSLVVTFGFQDSFWFAISKWEVLEFFFVDFVQPSAVADDDGFGQSRLR